MKIYVGNGQFFADGFAVRRSFSLEEGESRLLSYVASVGCGAARVSLSQGALSVEGGTIGVIRWIQGAELYPLPTLRPWECAAEREIPLGSDKVLVRIHGGEPSSVEVTGAASYRHSPALPIYAPRITLIEGQRYPIARIDAHAPEGEYIAMIALAESGCRLLLEECGERISCEGNEVRIERAYADMLSRRVTIRCLWRGDRFESSREIVCAKEHIFIREECGRALLEAAMAKDPTAITALLSPEIGDAAAILDYFGEILAVRTPYDHTSPTAAMAVTRGDKGLVATVYDFDFDESGRIANIRSEE